MIVSNRFNITLLPQYSVSATNKIGQIMVFKNYYTQVRIPDDMFSMYPYQTQNASVLHSTNWIEQSEIEIATRIMKEAENQDSTLFIKAFDGSGRCKISIFTNNSFCQTSEVLVDVEIRKWASKECYQCKGPTEADWLQWAQGLILNSEGSCLPKTSKFPTLSILFYQIWGVITMILSLAFIVLSLKYGRIMLEQIYHMQTFMIYWASVYNSSENFNINLHQYFSWTQFAKFDLWYLSFGIFENELTWTPSSFQLKNMFF